MKNLLLPLVVVLTGCNTPKFENLSAPSKTVVARGLTFKVIYTGDQAEAFRLTALRPSRFREVPPAALEAMERASGCAVNPASLSGDPAKYVADLAC